MVGREGKVRVLEGEEEGGVVRADGIGGEEVEERR